MSSSEEDSQQIKNLRLYEIIRSKTTQEEMIPKISECLKDGANVNATNSKGKTILMIAQEKKYNEVISYLLNQSNIGKKMCGPTVDDYSGKGSSDFQDGDRKIIATSQNTVADGNCFFHAVFGIQNERNQYEAERAQDMREEWFNFLFQYRSLGDQNMPSYLKDVLHKIFIVFFEDSQILKNKKLEMNDVVNNSNGKSNQDDEKIFSSEEFYERYLNDIKERAHFVLFEEIPILVSLADVTVTLFYKKNKMVFEPNRELLGGYQINTQLWNKMEASIYYEENHFSHCRIEIDVEYGQKLSYMNQKLELLCEDTLNDVNNKETTTNDVSIDEEFLNKLKMIKKGMSEHGNLFQLKVLMLVFWRAANKYSWFRLATEFSESKKFDDVVFQYRKNYMSKWKLRLLQVKHKESSSLSKPKHIKGIFGYADGNFSLQKYFRSYLAIKQKTETPSPYSVFFQNEIEDVNVITNADFNDSDRKYFEKVDLATDEIFRLGVEEKGQFKNATIYKPSMDSGIVEKCLPIFKITSDCFRLLEYLVEVIVNGEINLKKEDLLMEYYYPLSKSLLEIQRDSKKYSVKLRWKMDCPFIDSLVEEIAFVTLFDRKKIKMSANFGIKKIIHDLQNSIGDNSVKDIQTLEELATNVAEDIKKDRELDVLLITQFNKLRLSFNQQFIEVKNKTFQPIFIHRKLEKLSARMQRFRRTFIKCLLTEEQKKEVKSKFEGKELEFFEKFATKYIPVEEPIIQDVSEFTEQMGRLILDNSDTKVITINEKTPSSFTENLQKLSGYLLAEKFEMIRFCSSFLTSEKLPENLKEFKKQLSAFLGEDFKKIYQYIFKMEGFDFKTCEDGTLEKMLPILHTTNDVLEFFDKLKFIGNYPNRMDINHLLERNIRNKFKILDGKAFNSIYMEGMHDWMANSIGTFLMPEEANEMFEDISNNLSLWIMDGITRVYFADVPKGYQFRKSNEFVEFLRNEKRVLVISTQILQLTRIRIVQKFLNLQQDDSVRFRKYTRKFGHIFLNLKQIINDDDRSYVLNQIKSSTKLNLIVIECNTGQKNSELCRYFLNLLDTKDTLKIVLIAPHKNLKVNLRNKFKQESFDMCNFDDLDDKSKIKCLSQKITFQGQKTTFNDILGNDKTGDIICPDILCRMVEKKDVSISNTPPLSEGYHEIYYIERNIGTEVHVDLKILKDKNETVVVNEYEEEFIEKCKKFPENNVHWFKQVEIKLSSKKSDVLTWQKTKGSISNILKYRINENKLNKSVEEYDIIHNKNNIVIISDLAGMGKSTLLSHLTIKIKARFTDYWLVKIDLNNCTKILFEELRTNKFNRNDLDWAKNLLKKMTFSSHTKLDTDQEKKLFFHSLSFTKKIILLLDGVDEISPRYTNIIIELILALRYLKLEKIVITTRPNIAKKLEKRLNVFAYSLETFSEDTQLTFLVKFWRNKFLENISHSYNEIIENRLKMYAKDLIKKVSSLIENEQESFAGIPLQLRMLAEVFQNADQEQEYEGCFQFLKSNETKPKLPDKLNLYDLYTMFVKEKYKIYSKKKIEEDKSNVYVEQANATLYKQYRKLHCRLALYSFFDENDLKLLLSNKKCNKLIQKVENVIKDIEIGEERGGLIVQVVNNRPKFVHRTFMEYFVAEFIVDAIEDHNNNTNRAEFIIKSVFFAAEYKIVRSFINNLLGRKQISESEFYGETMNSLWKLDENYISGPLNSAILSNNQQTVRFLLGCLNNYKSIRTRTYQKIYLLHLCGNLDLIKLFVENDYDVNNTDMFNNTLLHFACMYSYFDEINWLVKQEGIDVNLRSKQGQTPLHEMMKWPTEHSLEILKVLIESGADINISDPGGLQPLHYAVRTNRIDLAKFLIKYGADCSGKTVLHFVAKNNRRKFYRRLIENCKVDVNQKTKNGFLTPLHYAVMNRNVELIKLLIENGKADVNPKSKSGHTPLHLAIKNGNVEVTKILLNDYKADVNSETKKGDTPLRLAVQGSNIELIKMLIDHHNANVDSETSNAYAPLHISDIKDNIKLCKLIEQYRADLNSEKIVGFTLLHYAIKKGNVEMVNMLIDDYNVSVYSKTAEGYTPLHLAVINDKIEFCKMLIEQYRADVNSGSLDGFTPFHYAVKNGNVELIKMLINNYNANLVSKTTEGYTALHIAVVNNKIELFKVLVEQYSADVNAVSLDGSKPLHYAVQ